MFFYLTWVDWRYDANFADLIELSQVDGKFGTRLGLGRCSEKGSICDRWCVIAVDCVVANAQIIGFVYCHLASFSSSNVITC